ncbi:MAG: hypothetical protein EZS28_019373 [Streblomastix strix]|uniref:Uncharacterized protein n=1 Tax=Streblomastix strix TaxID=222440 RepID=A0A5J4VRC9_9EUKA|nr:MAG: hypothetical protein EZS28_019373 [Streblomastix strix]
MSLYSADQRHISNHLERLVHTLGVQNATANSIRFASSTELAVQGFGGRTINIFTHNSPDSTMNQEFYVFEINRQQDSTASALEKNHGEKQAEPATQTVSKQSGDARVSDGDVLQQSAYVDDLQSSPQETLATPLSFLMILTQRIVEVRSPNDRESTCGQESQIQRDDQDEEQSS